MSFGADFEQLVAVDNCELQCSAELLRLIKEECDSIASSRDRFASNYTFERLDLPGHQAFDLLMSKGKIVGWCGLYNGGRYPDGVFRIMNRLYLHPDYRSPFFKPYTRKLYFSQIQRHKEKVRMLFLSRNDLKGKFHVRRWVKYGANEEGWEVSKGLVKVAPAENRKCYQYIAFKKYAPVDWPHRMINEDEWWSLPE